MSMIDMSSPNATVLSVLLSLAASIWVWGSGRLDVERTQQQQARSTEAVESSRRARALAEDCYATTLQIEHAVRTTSTQPPSPEPGAALARYTFQAEPSVAPRVPPLTAREDDSASSAAPIMADRAEALLDLTEQPPADDMAGPDAPEACAPASND